MRDPTRARPRIFAALAALTLLAACSKHDQSDVTYDAKDAAKAAQAEASKMTHDPAWKRVAADLKRLGHHASQDLRKGADQGEAATNAVVTDAKRAAHRVGERQDQADRTGRDSSSS